MSLLNRPTPISTYRLQFNDGFKFRDACAILDYLRDLGITDIYASPILTSRHGSNHGYDVTDPTRINPDLGTEEDFELLQKELQKRDMGLLLDIVPNHMAASSEDPWWMDVLENGSESAFASYFDIDWHPPSRDLDGRILLPVLGRPFGEVIDNGEIKIVFREGRFFAQYFEAIFPLAHKSYRRILKARVEVLSDLLGEASPDFQEYSGLLAALSALYERGDSADGSAASRLSFENVRERLRQLSKNNPAVCTFIQENLQQINGTPHDAASFVTIERILAEQYYALAFWQNINKSINYRRFFTITDLVGVRVEDPLVFDATHSLLLRLISRGGFSGLRIDHIDGLRDPFAYLNRLQEKLADPSQPDSMQAYVIVEKILARTEYLPLDWAASGTTGYEFLNFANSLFVKPDGAKAIERIYANFIGNQESFEDILYKKKKLVMSTLLAVEMRSLGRQLGELAALDRYARDLPRLELADVLVEVTACMSVYRTYIRNLDVPADASELIDSALREARRRRPRLESGCFDFLRAVLLVQNPAHVQPGQRESRLNFVMRWQQFTGPIVAKGFEDTALYVYHPMLSLNDVGGEPRPSQISEFSFSDFIARRQAHWPNSLNASTTHDTKRSEDVRARINAISEAPEEWESHLALWSKLNSTHKKTVAGATVPDCNEEYFIYQTLVGAWPVQEGDPENFRNRLHEYVVKATREAMVHTRWTQPNDAHENALKEFVTAILHRERSIPFLESLAAFEKKISYRGMINGLGQALLKIASPGIPDFYQGSELWDLRLVDPDNRGQIDYQARATLMDALNRKARTASVEFARELVTTWRDSRIKLYLIWKTLNFRRAHAALFAEGTYEALPCSGSAQENVFAFQRVLGEERAIVVIPRWDEYDHPQEDRAKDARLQVTMPPSGDGALTNLFTGQQVSVSESALSIPKLFQDFPVALLYSR